MALYVSPLLKDRIVSNNTYKKEPYSQSYADLKRHANDVKPNAPKAKLVRGGIINSISNAVTDTKNDVSNFFEAVKTGNVGDNNLGRLNDLGLKLGALGIASFLAINARTTTDKVMKFLGGGAFIAVMDLWPKLFINLPARIVHGFDIGQKYISAQGEKKDFFLDNQFLPWDAYSEQEMREIGEKTGIDYDSKNGREKIQRKMQKTALQNRTLWMATAGFATPLMTSMVCGAVEPGLKNFIINKNFNKVKNIINSQEGIEGYINGISASDTQIAKIDKQLNSLFKNNTTTTPNKDFFNKLAKIFNIGDLKSRFSDSDDLKPLNSFNVADKVAESLEELYKTKALFDKDELIQALTELTFESKQKVNLTEEEAKNLISQLGESVSLNALKELLKQNSEFDIKDIARLKTFDESQEGLVKLLTQTPLKCKVEHLPQFSKQEILELLEGKDLTVANVRNIFSDSSKYNKETMDSILGNVKVDNSPFFDAMHEFNKTFFAKAKEKVVAYTKLINSVAGEKAESVFTKEYLKVIDNLLKNTGFTDAQIRDLLSEKPTVLVPKLLQKYFENLIKGKEYPNNITPNHLYESLSEEAMTCTSALGNNTGILNNINVKDEYKDLADTILGNKKSSGSVADALKKFLDISVTNIETFKSKFLLMPGLERRIKSGELQNSFRESGLVGDATPIENLVELARHAIYDGSSGNASVSYGLLNESQANTFKNIVFDANAYKLETSISGDAKRTIEKTLEILKRNKNDKETYIGASSVSNQAKSILRMISNNRTWKHIFVPASVVLVAITLLVQPLFGKIAKEYSEKSGGDK